MKKVMTVWTIVLVLIVGGMTVLGFKMKSENANNLMEENIIKQGKKYLGLYPGLYPNLGEKVRITAEKLKDEGYDALLEKDCTGYLEVETLNSGFDYRAFVSCPEYVTGGYTAE